jgi:hypothetical protein
VPLPREHHARVLVLDGHGYVRERLVVAKADVERRPVALDEVLLEVEGLDLGVRDDHLDVGDAPRQLRHRRARVGGRLEVAPDAGTKRLRLPDVQHVAPFVPEQVDAGLRRERLQLVLEFGNLPFHGN